MQDPAKKPQFSLWLGFQTTCHWAVQFLGNPRNVLGPWFQFQPGPQLGNLELLLILVSEHKSNWLLCTKVWCDPFSKHPWMVCDFSFRYVYFGALLILSIGCRGIKQNPRLTACGVCRVTLNDEPLDIWQTDGRPIAATADADWWSWAAKGSFEASPMMKYMLSDNLCQGVFLSAIGSMNLFASSDVDYLYYGTFWCALAFACMSILVPPRLGLWQYLGRWCTVRIR